MAAIIVQIRIVVTVMMMMVSGKRVGLMRGVEVEVRGKHQSIIDTVPDPATAFVVLSVWIRHLHVLLLSQDYHFFLC